jgi:hypothetical protein
MVLTYVALRDLQADAFCASRHQRSNESGSGRVRRAVRGPATTLSHLNCAGE